MAVLPKEAYFHAAVLQKTFPLFFRKGDEERKACKT